MFKHYFLQRTISNELLYYFLLEREKRDMKKLIFKLVLKYKFNIQILIKIVNTDFRNGADILILLQQSMRLNKNLSYLNAKKYYIKYLCPPPFMRYDNNLDNFKYYSSLNFEKACYFYSFLTIQEKELIMTSDLYIFHPFLKDKYDTIIMNCIISRNIIYEAPLDFVYNFNSVELKTINVREYEVSLMRNPTYLEIITIRDFKYVFFMMCFNPDKVSILKYYYNKLFKLNNSIAPTILLDMIMTYKFQFDTKIVKTLYLYELLYEFDSKQKEVERMIRIGNLLDIISRLSNSYIFKQNNKDYITCPGIRNFLKDHSLDENKIKIIETNCINDETYYVLNSNQSFYQEENILFDRSIYIKCKQILRS